MGDQHVANTQNKSYSILSNGNKKALFAEDSVAAKYEVFKVVPSSATRM